MKHLRKRKSMPFKTIFEPFKIKMVEPIRLTTQDQRKQFLQEAHFNPFLLHSNDVLIDLLTDSGTSAMSSSQWAAMMEGEESNAGANSWLKLEHEIHDLTGYPFILPTHQGRAAERILYSYLGGNGKIFISNTHFDTTRANIEFSGATAIDIPCDEAKLLDSDFRFKGYMNTEALDQLLQKYAGNIGAVILTVTNNSGGGQPVSFQNAREVSMLCKKYNVLFIIDACRIAENSYFIKHHEPGFENFSYRKIAQQMFSLSDGCIMSAKKDALVNMGGFLALKNEALAQACTKLLIITEGFATYGGLSGRDMEALAVGLREVFDEDYLHYRISSTQYLQKNLRNMGVPVMHPAGGHAVYIDAHKLYPHIPLNQYPGQALVCNLYLLGGIRCVEVGSLMFGKYDEQGNLVPAPKELVRLAIPRRVYTKSHMDYVIEVFGEVMKSKHNAKGLRITYEPKFLRHFTAHLKEIKNRIAIGLINQLK